MTKLAFVHKLSPDRFAVECDGTFFSMCPCCGQKFSEKEATVVVEKLNSDDLKWTDLLVLEKLRQESKNVQHD